MIDSDALGETCESSPGTHCRQMFPWLGSQGMVA